MTTEKEKVLFLKTCNVGTIGDHGVALRMNFVTKPDQMKDGPEQHAIFALSRELATGLIKALEDIIADIPKKPSSPKHL